MCRACRRRRHRQGTNVTIDENGDSEGSYILLGLVRDEETGCAEDGMPPTALEKVGYFHYSEGPAVSRMRQIELKKCTCMSHDTHE